MVVRRKKGRRGAGSCWQLPSGSWRAEVPTPAGPLRKTFPREREAVAWVTATAAARDARTLTAAPGSLTVGDRIDAWLAAREGEVDPRTMLTYRYVVDRLVRPTAGAVRLADLTADWGQRWLGQLVAAGLTADQRRRAVGLLKAVFAADVGGLLPANPLARVRRPKVPRKPVAAYTRDQALALLAHAGPRYGPMVRLALDAGLRPGELLALRWEDFDPESGSIRVRRALRNLNGKLSEKSPKTAAGIRTVLLVPATVAALADLPRPFPLLFPTRTGLWVSPRNIAREFARVCGKAGVPALGLRACRHTSATLLLAAGAPIKAVSARLGHESVEITLKFYAAHLPDDQERCRQAAAAVFV